MPEFNPNKVVDRSMVLGCDALAQKWLGDDGRETTSEDLKGMLSKQVMFFLDLLITSDKILSHGSLEKLDSLYRLSSSKNVEIHFRYLMISLKSTYRGALASAAAFLSVHGRGLYAKPLFRELKRVDHEFAKKVFSDNRTFYHSVIRNYCHHLQLHC